MFNYSNHGLAFLIETTDFNIIFSIQLSYLIIYTAFKTIFISQSLENSSGVFHFQALNVIALK